LKLLLEVKYDGIAILLFKSFQSIITSFFINDDHSKSKIIVNNFLTDSLRHFTFASITTEKLLQIFDE